MGERKYKYILKVVIGTFKGDQWEFSTINQCDRFIVETIKEGNERLVWPGTMEIHHKRKKVANR